MFRRRYKDSIDFEAPHVKRMAANALDPSNWVPQDLKQFVNQAQGRQIKLPPGTPHNFNLPLTQDHYLDLPTLIPPMRLAAIEDLGDLHRAALEVLNDKDMFLQKALADARLLLSQLSYDCPNKPSYSIHLTNTHSAKRPWQAKLLMLMNDCFRQFFDTFNMMRERLVIQIEIVKTETDWHVLDRQKKKLFKKCAKHLSDKQARHPEKFWELPEKQWAGYHLLLRDQYLEKHLRTFLDEAHKEGGTDPDKVL